MGDEGRGVGTRGEGAGCRVRGSLIFGAGLLSMGHPAKFAF